MTVAETAPETSPKEPDVERDVPPRAGLMLLILAIGMGIYLAIASESFPVVIFILAIVVMVMIHEAGHFFVAKKAGMKVTQFFFGFGPRLWSFHRGETEYGVRALPFGGFVKIIGMSNMESDIDPADEPRTYRQQSFGKRVAVAVAGVATHFIVAFVVLTFIWVALGWEQQTLRIGSIGNESAAAKAGFQLDDEIVSIDGNRISEWSELPPYVRERPNEPLTFVVRRGGEVLAITATPAEVAGDEGRIGFLGVGPAYDVERASLPTAIVNGAKDTGIFTWKTLEGIATIFSPSSLNNFVDHVTGSPEAAENPEGRPVSVVGAARLADQAAEYDVRTALLLFVSLNIFVAVINMVPLLPFDGGHVAIASYEAVRSRKGRRYYADQAKMLPVTILVTGFFILLGVTSIWLDIVNPMQNPFQ